ncbi:fatty acid desaturase family protein [Aetokthonos hydrillicola Thurmond2011]|jgi:hypothetical protein|uniref:Fatty acid desaturase family protein n=1 Tax=Aetokthonos hydrillicola Thurmond2011 TaxID=2712845 RepID=A0AAP5M6D5_9CYAN|nr:fatty acid hydroxylase [Aetokthonos hydrillicola]MBO3462556.1 fatty acid hydroxylase [Aetokthonos hydrillicola CCALA 1050]MBW4590344.1 fatty acid desaturase family protein [Aetokthonos hydrillicola CCALA 1050]MDR9896886.1 fatty acid desaturase family protein [Aetokthonos hydrillicola Thurmond2011]
MLEAIATAWLLLFFGDLLSTFIYHVPEHVFGSLHLKTHHSAKKAFRHYAILLLDTQVLLDGILGALPYLFVAIFLSFFSPIGTICGLLFGQFHVWWRHTSVMGWQTPKFITFLCQILFITTPEQHWIHHQKPNLGFGDIFTLFEQPAQTWFRWLRLLRLHLYSSSSALK